MSSATSQPARTETQFEWSFLEEDGVLFKRFRRAAPVELWLYGIERPLDLSLRAGKWILQPTGEHIEAQRAVWPFQFDPENVELAMPIVEAIREEFPSFPRAELLEQLLLLSCASPNPFEDRLSQADKDEIVERIVERLHG